ncbi:MAG: DNA-directed RNA polymerase subunit omega [Defluviitaleaceae bacterium]|nr:DNA-directed RNA polymerase subunit omega [Defluviitaleaceae bacterium]
MNDLSEASEKDITSRYSIVIAVAKRARQITAGDKPMVDERADKAISTSVKEMSEGKLKIVDL